MSEVERLRAFAQSIRDDYVRRSRDYHPDHKSGLAPTGQAWGDGYHTAVATYSLKAHEALDPEEYAEHEAEWRASFELSAIEWFKRTGNCGDCGNPARHCTCDGACSCGPHDLSFDPETCWVCHGTGTLQSPAAKVRAESPIGGG